MMKRYARPMMPDEIAAVPDAEIDFSDVPELDEAFWTNAKLVEPDRTQSVTLRVKTSVLNAYEQQGRGYQTRMNAVLESYARATLKHE
ncbi:3-oxoacyl-ACP synthase [Methylobacterium sp. Leaf87]|uniref:BrnA antitoxin family protein n=1 Tax=Methylobacterium sp. Leaf87 TaxID=1736243 RepID=UPI0006FFD0B6|nr:BrnA antitoxin family protein [Methylobacterium sp. Leaf87]KQO69665.1 3-oxoacyl-ACP synthase [Methylobacterium sp. Leaf87]